MINILRRINFTTLISLVTPALIIGAATYTAVSTWLVGLGWNPVAASVYGVLCTPFGVALELNGIKAAKQLVDAVLRRDWPLARLGAINVSIYLAVGIGALLIVHALPVGIIALGIAAFIIASQGYLTNGIKEYEARQRAIEDRETAVKVARDDTTLTHELEQDALDKENARQLKVDNNNARLERLALRDGVVGKGEKSIPTLSQVSQVVPNLAQVNGNGKRPYTTWKKVPNDVRSEIALLTRDEIQTSYGPMSLSSLDNWFKWSKKFNGG